MPIVFCALALLAPAAGQPALDGVWTLAFSDDFERAELGDAWFANDAAIRGGRMLLGRNQPACAKLVRPFPGDVRIEFTAQAFEGKPPCDLSVTLAAERLDAMSWNYLLAFGGVNNTVNKLTGGSKLKEVWEEKPARRIEPGRVYRIVATKEGNRIALEVDGTTLLASEDADVMGGPGFDAVGLVTWNGMYVDDVRVYERTAPHPDTPRYVLTLAGLVVRAGANGRLEALADAPAGAREATDLYNRKDFTGAARAFLALEGEARAAGLAYVYGNLWWDERPGDLDRLAELFAELAAHAPGDRRLADYAWAASTFARVRLYPRDPNACGLLIALGREGNPFYDKALLYRARFLRANGLEGASREQIDKAGRLFAELETRAPGHPILRQLTGAQIPWGEALIRAEPGTPRWAAAIGELYARQLAILTWWFRERQFPDGQLGGGWGDDVEILRSWGPFALISNARPEIAAGMEKLCDGVWDHVLVEGFDGGYGDVEHSAEPSADTIPTMLALRYGDPRWYERNLASCRRIRDRYTGIDAKGHVRFKSAHFGGERAGSEIQEGGDNYYSSRPMKHFLWAAWYGDAAARAFYLDWVEGWRAATMAPAGTKIAGIPPANIWFPSGEIAPPNGAPWNDPDYNYMGCCWLGNFWIHDTFLAAYALSRDPRFLEPFHTFMAWQLAALPPQAKPDPRLDDDPLAWAIREAKGGIAPATTSEYRWLTGDPSYDTVFGGQLDPALRLQMAGELMPFVESVEREVKGLRVNFDLHTREVIQTDRAGLAGAGFTFGAFTGGVRLWVDAGWPTMAVTWDVPHADFAAAVLAASREHVRVLVYNFRSEPLEAGLRLWQLVPGEYAVRAGAVASLGPPLIVRWGSRAATFRLRGRAGTYAATIPGREETMIDFRLVRRTPLPEVLPDPAVGARDVTVGAAKDGAAAIAVTVHNLGSAAAPSLAAAIVDAAGRTLARASCGLPACKDLVPATAELRFDAVAVEAGLRVVLDPEDCMSEIDEANNAAPIAGR